MTEPLIKTSCRDCIFAQFEKGPKIDVQIGCSLDRLAIFDTRGEVKYEIDEGEKLLEYAVIQRFCNACRNQKWLEDNPGKDKTIMTDIAINYGVVMYISEPFDLLDTQYTISCIHNQLYKPKAIHIVFDKHNVPSNGYAILRALTDIPITFTKVLSGTPMKTGSNLCDNQFFVFINAGQFFPSAFSIKVNKALNEDMIPFLIAKYKNIILINRLVYDMLKSDDVVNEVKQKAPDMILEL